MTYKQIADFIIKEVQEKSTSGFHYIVGIKDVMMRLSLKSLMALQIEKVMDELESRKEVADAEFYNDGFDVVLYTDHAPSYIKEED